MIVSTKPKLHPMTPVVMPVPDVPPIPVEPRETFGQRVRRSWTMFVAWVVIAIGFAPDVIDILAAMSGAPEVQVVIKEYFGTWAPHLIKGLGIAVALARIKGLMKGK